ncbi:complex I subunit 4 family protein [Tundrisphaera sp. TA3]|uniref:complex I subunit 4 family protein n=1 Tax=Tundrisphaera sp. TA3 TaxID=3435775 RepID=UPI003EBDF043
MSDDLLLSLLWIVPLGGAAGVLLIPDRRPDAIRRFALGTTVLTLLLSLAAFARYTAGGFGSKPLAERAFGAILDAKGEAYQAALVVRHTWIPYFDIQYYLGLDGINLALVLLSAFVGVLACLASWNIDRKIKAYFGLYLLLLSSMMGVFLALDLVLFYVFFELMLLPMYFLIAIWGGDRREYAAMKFLLYTLFGSVFILVGFLALYFWSGDATGVTVGGKPFDAHTFDMVRLARAASETAYYGRWIQGWIFLLLFLGFSVKLPSIPFHTWLPDAHVQAPTPISMILAGVLLKVGGYGFLRLAWPLAPAGAHDWAWVVAVLGTASILYGALAAMAQDDFKKLVAYSSVSHMGYVTLGMAAMNLAGDPRYYAYGLNGALFMMVAHGITSTAMFFLVGVIYERTHTRDLRAIGGGLVGPMPIGAAVSAVIFFGSMGLPGLCGFVAEVFVILAAFRFSPLLGALAAAAVVLTAGYILWTIQRVFLGRREGEGGPIADLRPVELIIAVPLVVLTIWLGVIPGALLSWAGPSVDRVARDIVSAKSHPVPAPTAVAREAAEPTPRPLR